METPRMNDIDDLVAKTRGFLDEEVPNASPDLTIDALMNAMVHIAADARPDVSLPKIIEMLIEDFSGYRQACDQMIEEGDILPEDAVKH
jgi:hypothetical protein